LVNGEEKREEEDIDNNGSNQDEEEQLHPWIKGVEVPTFDGSDPQGWIVGVEIFFEVHSIKRVRKITNNSLNWCGRKHRPLVQILATKF